MKRWEVGFALAALVVLAGFQVFGAESPSSQAVVERSGRFFSVGWYCPVPHSADLKPAVSTTNLGAGQLPLRLWSVSGSRRSSTKTQDVDSLVRFEIPVADLGLPGAAAVVEAFESDSVTDSFTSGSRVGATYSRCETQPFDRWLFATASTARTEDTYLLLANPFEEEAVVRVRILTDKTDTVPARLKDFVVPELSQTVLFLADFFPETQGFSIDLSAIRGRVIAARFMRVKTKTGFTGIFSDVGVRSPSRTWYFGGGEVPTSGEEFLVLMNPSDSEALVTVLIHSETEQLAPPGLQEISVPAGRRLAIRLSNHVPRGTRHGLTVSSTNRVSIVAERQTFGSLAGVKGASSVFGVPSPGGRLVAPGGASGGSPLALSLVNHSEGAVTANITLLSSSGAIRPEALRGIEVPAGRRLTLRLESFLDGKPATVVVDAPSGGLTAEVHSVIMGSINDFADIAARILD